MIVEKIVILEHGESRFYNLICIGQKEAEPMPNVKIDKVIKVQIEHSERCFTDKSEKLINNRKRLRKKQKSIYG